MNGDSLRYGLFAPTIGNHLIRLISCVMYLSYAVAISGTGLRLRNRTSRFKFCTVAAK